MTPNVPVVVVVHFEEPDVKPATNFGGAVHVPGVISIDPETMLVQDVDVTGSSVSGGESDVSIADLSWY